MFLQICLLAAGIHYGRRRRRPSLADTSVTALTPIVEQAGERDEIVRQFDLALVCMGLSTVTGLFFPHLRVLGGAAVLYANIPILQRARERLVLDRRIGAEALDSLGVLTTLAARDFIAAAAVFLFYAGGRRLGLDAELALAADLDDAMASRTGQVWLVRGDAEERVPFTALQAGDVVVVDAGTSVPIDGVIVAGDATVDRLLLTGESNPQLCAVGDAVESGVVVVSGRLQVRAATSGAAAAAAELALRRRRLTRFAADLAARGQHIADAAALPTIMLSAVAYPLVGAQGSVALLNSSFIDNMRVLLPLSTLNGLRRSSAAGVQFRDGRALHALAGVDTVVFDKTGTLTLPALRVRDVHPSRGVDIDDVLRTAAAAELHQDHPLAVAIVAAAERRGLMVTAADDPTLELGYGVTARQGGAEIHVGSRRFMAMHDIRVSAVRPGARDPLRITTRVLVARDRELLGELELESSLRPGARELLHALKARGLALHLVSGDHAEPTRALARDLGFTFHRGHASPIDKARFVDALQSRGGRVCFVGDALADCHAFARAAVSVTLGGADSPAVERAQFVVPDLAALSDLFTAAEASRAAVRRVEAALTLPSIIGVAGVLFAGFGDTRMTFLYGASMLAGLGLAMEPLRRRVASRTASDATDLPG